LKKKAYIIAFYSGRVFSKREERMFYFMIRIAFLGILSFVFIEKLELQAQESRLLVVGTQEEFEKALQSSVPDLCIFLKAGIYEGKTQAYTDPSLGNGEDPSKNSSSECGSFFEREVFGVEGRGSEGGWFFGLKGVMAFILSLVRECF
jgi:hypothetical protein